MKSRRRVNSTVRRLPFLLGINLWLGGVTMFTLSRLTRMRKDQQLQWFYDRLAKINTPPPGESKAAAISDLMDLSVELGLNVPNSDLNGELSTFRNQAQIDYLDLLHGNGRNLWRNRPSSMIRNSRFVTGELSVPIEEIRRVSVKQSALRKLLSRVDSVLAIVFFAAILGAILSYVVLSIPPESMHGWMGTIAHFVFANILSPRAFIIFAVFIAAIVLPLEFWIIPKTKHILQIVTAGQTFRITGKKTELNAMEWSVHMAQEDLEKLNKQEVNQL
jgi:hypothetical protein